jgi:predicted nucleic acid-binding Zn ribbon protein
LAGGVLMSAKKCVYCRGPLPEGSMPTRQTCSDQCRWNQYKKKRRRLRLCRRCPEKAQPGFSLCPAHREVTKEECRDLYADVTAYGLCVACKTDEACDGSVRCAACRQKEIDVRSRRRSEAMALGNCSRCFTRPARQGGPKRDGSWCKTCISRTRRSRATRRIPEKTDRIDDTLHVLANRGDSDVYVLASETKMAVRTIIRHTRRLLKAGRIERYLDGNKAIYRAVGQ